MASKKSAKASATKKAKAKKATSRSSSKTIKKASTKSTPATVANQIDLKQTSTYRGNDWWDWSVWIEAPATVLDQIEYVDYGLHPTFPDRVQRRTNRDEKFRLDSSGWGEFMIDVHAERQDGSSFKTKHWLTLEYPSPTARSMSTSTPTKKKEVKRPTVFLSAGVSDLRMGNAIGHALAKQGLRVLKTDDPSDLPWDVAIAQMIKTADLMVLLISGGLTSWAMREIDAAMSRELPILPVIIGPVATLPEEIESMQHINLKEGD
jgi:hypothetical protein